MSTPQNIQALGAEAIEIQQQMSELSSSLAALRKAHKAIMNQIGNAMVAEGLEDVEVAGRTFRRTKAVKMED